MHPRRLAFTLLALAAAACDRKPEAPAGDVPPAVETALDKEARCKGGAALAITALTVEWQEGGAVHRFTLAADGRVEHDGKPFGRFQGACLLDTRGAILRAVDPNGGVTDAARRPSGTFRSTDQLPIDGMVATVGDVWVDTDGEGLAVGNEGTVFAVPPTGEAFTLPAGVEGRAPLARRAVLLLLAVRPGHGQ